jgi:branched-chain amino acid transport system permease protein
MASIRRRSNPEMVVDYRDDVGLFRTRGFQLGMLALLVLYLLIPNTLDDFWVGVLNYCAFFAIGGIGLNLLTGFTGQVSLGHAFFVGVGAYSTAYFGGQQDWPMILWLPMSALVGGVLGALIGPVALRLHGNYLAIVTIGLLFLGEHIFTEWDSVTGGGRGTQVGASLELGPLDFTSLELFGTTFSRDQGLFWLLWAVVAITALIAKNVVRTRPGRAMQAIRDRDVAAEVVGVSLVRYKVGAFAISSAMAAVAGAFYGAAIQQFVSPVEFGGTFGLIMSITFVAVIIVGGMGTVFGSILGALVVGALPRIIQRFSADIPFLSTAPGDDGILSVASFNNMVFGALIIIFLLVEPRGLAALWLRAKAWIKFWPFSY